MKTMRIEDVHFTSPCRWSKRSRYHHLGTVPRAKRQHKTVLLDASSAILLAKAGYHEIMTEAYACLLSESVFHEITRLSLPGCDEYRQLLQVGKVARVPMDKVPQWCEADDALHKLDRGERDTILLFHGGVADFIVTDDGAAAVYCLRNKVPFVNSLLILRLLKQAGLVADDSFARGFQTLLDLGRYSERVKEYAVNCPDSDLFFFLP